MGACVEMGRGKGRMCGGRGDLYVECGTKNKREDLKERFLYIGNDRLCIVYWRASKNLYVFQFLCHTVSLK